ncbi:response regulator transcription factor [Hyphomonas sp. WL0036]|uniref:response regulator transcription factor n=1 Tax=Hyphomonas sediminis TaxID=2866160 RepID=UPI001C7E6AEA|nr:response regulator transcription factor [Hyphomonas sediminis]MBY9065918.1 response regulator transcription factor [Hyphomonas sediminis]
MTGRKIILIVDDEADLRETLAEQFELSDGFEALTAESGEDALKKIADTRIDLVILDVDMPGMNGREVCRRMRDEGIRTPVIMLTGRDGEADTVAGLESGANDYVSKPFSFAVLLARVRTQLRSFEQTEDATFEIGPYEFRPSTKVLRTKEGRRIRLTEKETEILKFLYRAAGKPVARETLLSEVWGYNAAVTTHTLETHIYRLRQKVEPDPSNAQLLLTDTGGYRLRP